VLFLRLFCGYSAAYLCWLKVCESLFLISLTPFGHARIPFLVVPLLCYLLFLSHLFSSLHLFVCAGKVVPEEALDEHEKMKRKLGNNKQLDKMTRGFVRLAKKVRNKSCMGRCMHFLLS